MIMKKDLCFYEHEIKVKIVDNILLHSKDWNWFYKYNEDIFSPNINVDSFNGAINAFFNVNEAFSFLCRIREICDLNFNITQDWLSELDQLALLYAGKRNLGNVCVNSEFGKIYKLLIYSGKIYSQIYDKKFTVYNRIFITRNLFCLENIDLFVEHKDIIIKLLDDISIDVSVQKDIFCDNINEISVPADIEFINRHINDFYSADCFHFHNIRDNQVKTWEDEELLKMLSVFYEDNRIIPMYSNGEYNNPEYEIWTELVLKHIKDYYSSECVNFIVESVAYALYKIQPSAATVNKHVDLLLDFSQNLKENENANFNCSSLNFVVEFISSYKHLLSKESFKKYNEVLEIIIENGKEFLLFEIKDKGAIVNKKVNQRLNEIINEKINSVDQIDNCFTFLEYIRDKRIQSKVKSIHVSKLSEIFNRLIYENNSTIVATLFLEYFLFLLRIKNNINVSAENVSFEILRIRELWQKEFFQKSIEAMSIVKSGPFVISKDQEDNYVYDIMNNPYKFALDSMKLGNGQLIESMSNIASHALLLMASRINICEDFPQKPFLIVDGAHPIDELYFKEIEKERSEKAHKLLNNLKTKEFISGIYNRIKDEMRMKMAFLKNPEPLYAKIKEQLSEYELIDYSDEPTLAHLTQLFPLLENQIRKLGELFNIVPICESEDKCHRLKEPDIVLKTIISTAYEFNDSMEVVADLFFVHFCMYGENGLNIRNDCVHGNHYCKKSEIKLAFKITLISLYVINTRYELIVKHLNEND